MAMSRQHYEKIAAAIKEQRSDYGAVHPAHGILDRLTDALADRFAADNAHFNRQRFLAAAGVSATTESENGS